MMGPWLKRLASLRLALWLIVAVGGAVLLSYRGLLNGTWALAVPLALLALNLLAAVATRPRFRRQRALLVFHLGLVAVVLLLAGGRLTYLRGTAEVVEGGAFDGQLSSVDAGPWHRGRLDRVQFVNQGFKIDYAPGVLRNHTRNAVRYVDEAGVERAGEVGDQVPLVLDGYRFYTTPNKGYAPTFAWYPAGGAAAVLGAVHLPSYPANQYRQAREWRLPGVAAPVWTMLQFDEVILDPARPSDFRLPSAYKVVVRVGALRRELQVGDALELPEGRLVFDGLRTWMGYSVFYDATMDALLLACMVSVAALGWHLAQRYAREPWNRQGGRHAA
jgi:cytochrome c biogenesis protein